MRSRLVRRSLLLQGRGQGEKRRRMTKERIMRMMRRILKSLPRKHPRKTLIRKKKVERITMMIEAVKWHIMEKDNLNYLQKNFKMQFIHPDKEINCLLQSFYLNLFKKSQN